MNHVRESRGWGAHGWHAGTNLAIAVVLMGTFGGSVLAPLQAVRTPLKNRMRPITLSRGSPACVCGKISAAAEHSAEKCVTFSVQFLPHVGPCYVFCTCPEPDIQSIGMIRVPCRDRVLRNQSRKVRPWSDDHYTSCHAERTTPEDPLGSPSRLYLSCDRHSRNFYLHAAALRCSKTKSTIHRLDSIWSGGMPMW